MGEAMISYFVRSSGSEQTADAHILEPGKNLITGEIDFAKYFGEPTSLESDLLTLASAIFAADRATSRSECESYQREIAIDVPVFNYKLLHPLVPKIEKVLRKLSDDWWSVSLRVADHKPEGAVDWPTSQTPVLLFSGGLDSLAAAVEFGKAEVGLNLVSHRTRNTNTDNAQRNLVKLLLKNSYKVSHRQFFVSSTASAPGGFDHDAEPSQRTRSFVFLVLAAVTARRLGCSSILMLAENGQMAIHLPLTSGRIGALSTHTAHPDVISIMEDILSTALNHKVEIKNPYLYKTKAETIAPIIAQLPQAVEVSTSCWRNAHLAKPATHCGGCIPCYVRKIAIETFIKDPTVYAEDVWSTQLSLLGEDHEGRRNLVDLAEFIRRFEISAEADLLTEFPELYSENIQATKAIAMYKRFSGEARAVLSQYPAPSAIL